MGCAPPAITKTNRKIFVKGFLIGTSSLKISRDEQSNVIMTIAKSSWLHTRESLNHQNRQKKKGGKKRKKPGVFFFGKIGNQFGINYESLKSDQKIEHPYRKKCSDILISCKWNEKNFKCCDEMLPLQTEYGVCYSINSLHTKASSSLQLMSNRETGPGELWLQTDEDVRPYSEIS
ncbi:hypothetical protein NQ317_008815 [Molorchus minor]|uniref:Uncharacterized protein n=1 Tax=Molorchus minor TaxID=1323400 RepID=A0ABQ9J1T3_9CUCU|nr:hypothetical protein NQ317_008815 [Molorchus minor]